MKVNPENTELLEVTLTVVANPEWVKAIEEHTELHDFFWEVFCMRNPLNAWVDRFQVVDVTDISKNQPG